MSAPRFIPPSAWPTGTQDAAAARLCHPAGDGGYGQPADNWRGTLAQIRREKSLLSSLGLPLRVDDRRLNLGQKALHFVAHALKFLTKRVLGRSSDAVEEHQRVGIGERDLRQHGLEGAFKCAPAVGFRELSLCEGGKAIGYFLGDRRDLTAVLVQGVGDDGLERGWHGGFLLNLPRVPRVVEPDQ